jgi:hypothetical protein
LLLLLLDAGLIFYDFSFVFFDILSPLAWFGVLGIDLGCGPGSSSGTSNSNSNSNSAIANPSSNEGILCIPY